MSVCRVHKSRILRAIQVIYFIALFLLRNPVHNGVMTQLLDQAFERVRALPPETQDEYARVLLRLAGEDEGDVYQLTPEEEADLIEAQGEMKRGEFATDEEVEAVLSKHRA